MKKFWEKTKEERKRFVINLEFSMLSSIVTISVLFLALHLLVPNVLFSGLTESYTETYIDKYSDDSLINEIATNCNQSSDYGKIFCLNRYFNENYNYLERKKGNLYSPFKVFSEGGVCRDATLIYLTLLNKLNIEGDWIRKDGEHVMALDWVNDSSYYFCVLDQKYMRCG